MTQTSQFIAYLSLMALLTGVAAVLSRASSFYRTQTEPQAPGRYQAIDGLRGYLALAVFVHHAVFNYYYWKNGSWAASATQFHMLLGPGAVILFFMITGLLFWSKAITGGARVPPLALYRSRFWRLAPMYIVAALVALAIIAVASGGRISVPGSALTSQLFTSLSCGLLPFPIWVNGIDTTPINAGVTWTLTCEWRFYLVLPLVAVFAKGTRFCMLASVVAAGYLLTGQNPHWLTWINFLFGMLAAHVVRLPRVRKIAAARWFVVVPMAAVTSVLMLAIPYYSLSGSCLLFAVFFPVACGNDMLGLLTNRAARFLGTISYSVYLLHGIALHILIQVVRWMHGPTVPSISVFWLLVAACGVILVGSAAVTFRMIEYSCLGWGYAKKPENAVIAPEEVTDSESAQATVVG